MTHVLIIDDAEDILELASIGLDIAGLSSSTASNSQQALQQLEQQPPDLILLDYQLGPESGLDLLPLLRQKCSAPVVFLTAASGEEQKFLAAGASGVLMKPFDPMSLGETLQPWLAGR
jgi:CheY-like chemotaxis protein